MSRSILGNRFRVSRAAFSEDVPIRLNIKKRRENVVYRTLSSNDNINITYVSGPDMTPASNFFVSDRSTSLTQNRIPSSQTATIQVTKTLSLNTDKFLVTDVFTVDTPTAPETPLFYKHTLAHYNSSLSDFSSRTLLSLEFMDYSFKTFKLTEYLLDTDLGVIYNNLENKYDDKTNSYNVSYVKYTIKITSGGATNTYIYHELINNEQVFEAASFDDVDIYGNILSGRKKYIVDQVPGGQYYIITLPSVAQYGYKETPNSRIKILPPDALNNKEPWNVRITNGHFIAALKNTPTSSKNYSYRIAEFDAQTFYPYPPYQTRVEQSAAWIAPTLIGIGKEIVYDATVGLFATIYVRSSDGTLKYVFTNNPDLIDTPYRESIYYTDGIESIDYLKGFIEVSSSLAEDDDITIDYITSEDTYVVTSIDFNPVDNLDALGERVAFYIIPETATTGTLSKSMYYLLIDPLGRIKYSSQAYEGGLLSNPDALTDKMLLEDFWSNGSPRHTFYYDAPSTTSGLQARYNGGTWTWDPSEFSFVDKYSVESVLFKDLIAPVGDRLSNYIDNGHVLILGDIYVGESSAPDSLSYIDVRVQGGGIKDEFNTSALQVQPEVMWYMDQNTAKPYPSVGSFFVEVPRSLLEDYGGAFTLQQVRDVVSRHMAAGGYPIIRTYSIDPVITEIVTTTTTAAITWPSYGLGTNYNVYKSTSSSHGFSLANSSYILDNIIGNSYTITGLSPGTKYYVKISAIDPDGYESFSQIVAAPTASS